MEINNNLIIEIGLSGTMTGFVHRVCSFNENRTAFPWQCVQRNEKNTEMGKNQLESMQLGAGKTLGNVVSKWFVTMIERGQCRGRGDA